MHLDFNVASGILHDYRLPFSGLKDEWQRKLSNNSMRVGQHQVNLFTVSDSFDGLRGTQKVNANVGRWLGILDGL